MLDPGVAEGLLGRQSLCGTALRPNKALASNTQAASLSGTTDVWQIFRSLFGSCRVSW